MFLSTLKNKFMQSAGSLFGLLLFCLALWAMFHALKGYHYQQIALQVSLIPTHRLLWSLLLTLVSYLLLTGYDYLALRYIQHPLQLTHIALASFIGNAFSHNLGFALLSGGSVRYRLYSSWGLSGFQITGIVAFCSATLWLGFFATAGTLFLLEPLTLPTRLHLPFDSLHLLGQALLVVTAMYLGASVLRRAPITLRGWEFTLPRPGLAASQLVLAILDWVVGGAVLYVLLPAGGPLTFPAFLAIYLLAQIAGVTSQVPGGLGVFEAVIFLFLSPLLPPTALLGAMLAYRAVYYFLPLGVAAILLGGLELMQRKEGMKRVARIVGEWLPLLTPQVIAFIVFVAGAILLFSGATPTIHWRLAWLRKLIPLPLLEISHLVSSIVGVGLLLVARGLQRRLDGAYHLTLALLATGIVASLLKGIDYEEAIALSITFIVLLPCRHYFYRKTSLISQRFTPSWIAAITLVLTASAWIGVFSYRYVQYSEELWWRFTFSGDAPRFLRSAVGVLSVAFIFGLARLLRAAPPEPNLPSMAELQRAEKIIEHSPNSNAHLALLGDKHLLFSDSGNSLIMYDIQDRTWVAMGDPIGPREEWMELLWRLREISNRHDGWTAFYQVVPESLPLYLDLGLTLLKLGEEARVELAKFSLEGSDHKSQRNLVNRIEKDGYHFEVLPATKVPEHLAQLRRVSDAWLEHKHTREKRFSVGHFDPDYMRRFPVAVLRKDAGIVAFANLWTSAGKEEYSIDLMRYVPDAPDGAMEYLFIKLMLHAKQENYRWFNLGMAPLSGLENRALAPLWNRLGSMVYLHGEHFYNFRGLRQYKMKFDPVWTPKYLASPGGFTLPRILTQIAALISGGLKGVVVK